MKKILFLCTGNSCRSQMAEGWAKILLAGKFEAYSAGTSPGAEVDRRAVKVMAEAGVDISAQRPKHVDAFSGQEFDLVVTLCGNARETCPAYWGKGNKMHQGFDDPATAAKGSRSEEETMGHYRRVRDEIKAFIEELWKPS